MEAAAIIIAIIALAGTVISVGMTTWATLHSEQRKRRSESEKVFTKYREPLLLATQDLQSRIYNITDGNLMRAYYHPNQPLDNRANDLLRYTSFLFGQFFPWVYILRSEMRFLYFITDKRNQEINELLHVISKAFAADKIGTALMLWREHQ